jgi:hypothetical protein
LERVRTTAGAFFFDRMAEGELEGMISFGMNPVANGPNTSKMIAALSKLKWMIVAENFETETAAFWKAGTLAPEYYPKAPEPENVATEVFLLPAACFAEKDGTFVNSSRWLQWKRAALEPPGEARPVKRSSPVFLEIGGSTRKRAAGARVSSRYGLGLREPSVSGSRGSREGAERTGRRDGAPGLGILRAERRRLDSVRQLALLRLLHRSGKHDGAERAGGPDGPRALPVQLERPRTVASYNRASADAAETCGSAARAAAVREPLRG